MALKAVSVRTIGDTPVTTMVDAGRAGSSSATPAPAGNSRKLLYVCGFSPSVSATSSGQKLAAFRIKEFANEFGSVDVLYFVNKIDALDNRSAGPPQLAGVGKWIGIELTSAARVVAAVRFPTIPFFVSVRRWAASSLISRLLEDGDYTDFFADFSQGIAAVPPRALSRFAFRQHDIVSKLYERNAAFGPKLLRPAYALEAARARRWESQVWRGARTIEVLTDEDIPSIRASAPSASVRAVSPSVTIALSGAPRKLDEVVKGRIIFWGNMARRENVDAVTWAVREILPRVIERAPHAKFWIVGAHPTREVMALAGENVVVTGFVDDPTEIFATAQVAIAPIRLGSGVKIKVLETVGAGIPTIASSAGAEGILANPLLVVADGAEELAEKVIQHLGSSPLA